MLLYVSVFACSQSRPMQAVCAQVGKTSDKAYKSCFAAYMSMSCASAIVARRDGVRVHRQSSMTYGKASKLWAALLPPELCFLGRAKRLAALELAHDPWAAQFPEMCVVVFALCA